MYKLTRSDVILRLADEASIPADDQNRDYRAFLDWVAEGNTPDPADSEPVPPPRIDVAGEVTADQGEKLAASVDLLTAYLKLATPTNAQTLGALKLTIRIVLWFLKRQGF